MHALLRLAFGIDKPNERIGEAVAWLGLASGSVCTGNAVARYAFDIGSNASLELQWYFNSAVFLLIAAFCAQAQRACARRRAERQAAGARLARGSPRHKGISHKLPRMPAVEAYFGEDALTSSISWLTRLTNVAGSSSWPPSARSA